MSIISQSQDSDDYGQIHDLSVLHLPGHTLKHKYAVSKILY
jgi:hypothetical protein